MKADCGLCQRYNHGCQYHLDDKDGSSGPRRQGARQCAAKKRTGPGRCKLPAGWGTDHKGFGSCRRHCGNTPGGRRAAQKELARHAVETYGLPREIEPHEALLEEIYRTAGHVDWLELQVRDCDPQELTNTPWIALYRHERQHLVDVCTSAIKAGIAERQVRLAEQQGRMIADVIRGVLTDLGVSDGPDVGKVVRRHLTLISGRAD